MTLLFSFWCIHKSRMFTDVWTIQVNQISNVLQRPINRVIKERLLLLEHGLYLFPLLKKDLVHSSFLFWNDIIVQFKVGYFEINGKTYSNLYPKPTSECFRLFILFGELYHLSFMPLSNAMKWKLICYHFDLGTIISITQGEV